MNPEQTQIPPSEWLSAFCPLGGMQNGSWTPVGAGILFVDAPVVWLLTTRRVLEVVGNDPLSAWVASDPNGALVDLTTGRRGGELDWIVHPELDLAACLFPVDPSWNIKAFAENRCFPAQEFQPLIPVSTVSCAYGMGPLTQRPTPLVLSGSIAGVDAGTSRMTLTAPLLPRNSGAPVLVPLPPQAGGGVALAGIVTNTFSVPEAMGSTASPVRLASALPIHEAISLVRGEQGKAQRKLAIASTREKAEATAPTTATA